MKPKKKKYKHIFSIKEEMEKCKNDTIYFYERYWLPYALGISPPNIRDTEKFLLETYWNMDSDRN